MSERRDSDEHYVIDLCDKILQRTASRQHRFDWLRGDPSGSGSTRRLPVDAYYVDLDLVVEYHERQHRESIAHFDKPDRLTVSGVHRGEQRRLYDERRASLLPEHGLRLVVIESAQLAVDGRGRLLRRRSLDLSTLRARLEKNLG